MTTRAWPALLALATAAACGDGSVEPPVPATLNVYPASATLVALGDTVRYSASLLDGAGQPIPDASIRWTTTDPSVAVVDASGLVTAVANGTTDVSATSAGLSGTATVIVAQIAGQLHVVAGAGQSARAGNALREAVTVVVEDGGGSPVSGAEVAFQPADGHGSVDPASIASDSAGRASTVWTLGEQPGAQKLVIAVGDVTGEVSAEALPHVPVVSFVDTAVSAAEGATVALAVTVSPPPSSPLTVQYELVADENPATTDADEADYTTGSGGSLQFGSTHPNTTIEVTIRDDDEIEAPREALVVRLLASERVYDLGASSATVVIEEGVCDRTPEVAEAIVSTAKQDDCPSVTSAHLTGISSLYVSGYLSTRTSVASLRAADFDGLAGLGDLTIDHYPESPHDGSGGLTELPSGIFAGLSNLERLSLFQHSLTQLPVGIFEDLRSLRSLDLSFNNFSHLPADMFAGLVALETLDLTGTRVFLNPKPLLKTVHEDAFAGLENLVGLSLRSNDLSELPEGVFRNLIELRRLDLVNNSLRRLPKGIFAGLHHLDVLGLSSNQLAELPRTLFAGLSNLRLLNLAANQLTELPDGLFAGLRSSQWVSLEKNPGAPFELTLQLERIDTADRLAAGPATVAVTVAEGAPLPVVVPLLVGNGSASDTVLALTPGETTGAGAVVRPTTGDSRATFLDLGQVPTLPSQLGFVLRTGDPLVLFANTRNSAPVPVGRIQSHIIQAGGPTAPLDLTFHFSDPDGDQLIYTVNDDPSPFRASVDGDQLMLTGRQEGESTLLLKASDPGGFFATQPVRVIVLPAPDPDVFNIDVVFAGHRTEPMDSAVREAAQRWMQVISGDLPDVPLSGNISPAGRRCYVEGGEFRFYGVVDDLLVFVGIQEPYGGVSGRGGTCLLRDSYLPYVGGLRINPRKDPVGSRAGVVKTASHEIGHALGFGTIWHLTGFLKNPTWRDGLGADTHFSGPLAIEAFDAAGGTNYVAGSKVPVENAFSVDAHWKTSYPTDAELRKGVFGGELMGGFGGGSILSAVTVQSLADLGYTVDVTKADPYRLYNGAKDGAAAAMAARETADAERLDFTNDVHLGFLAIADENGNIVRILRW
ncbi:MAG: leucine-rich repeat protein [Gemmatimonadetes bacterium]|nr:leucine-rich repeat protein [Gemmatimonadota bacterium]MYG23665.1 leucine-rich repeat protein [Gemmatimonadota bacterium]MYJ39482.1 leucine-rich repeat protein [Gemmatimonadota bacterium]